MREVSNQSRYSSTSLNVNITLLFICTRFHLCVKREKKTLTLHIPESKIISTKTIEITQTMLTNKAPVKRFVEQSRQIELGKTF